jgi:hypothetical protein
VNFGRNTIVHRITRCHKRMQPRYEAIVVHFTSCFFNKLSLRAWTLNHEFEQNLVLIRGREEKLLLGKQNRLFLCESSSLTQLCFLCLLEKIGGLERREATVLPLSLFILLFSFLCFL